MHVLINCLCKYVDTAPFKICFLANALLTLGQAVSKYTMNKKNESWANNAKTMHWLHCSAN